MKYSLTSYWHFAVFLIQYFSLVKCGIFSDDQQDQKKKKELSCGKPVNHTQYDHLRGIANRNEHGHIPEPEVALIFKKKGSKNSHVDISELEEKLKRMKKNVSKPWETETESSLLYFKTEDYS